MLVLAQKLQWPDKELIERALEAFPEKGVATVDEARVRSGTAQLTHWRILTC